ncbi:AIPR family protein [Rhodobacteraceae bacterium HSP-20]|uniref:AIPR family protein n=1 Tax=Paragemmobacter amnigenus TaxID=2852097 RepID=A0ABS6J0J7_9RHOB|nr:AIPR family protein [Rhodobacter amnigenus]MBU9697284.1 AIPR family protein [Rhodobacter amnigenus]MBV4388511.1 AIPR family protein [Rhodobacter amnigenus]
MSELEEYHQNLMADIRREADASGVFPVEAFFDRMTERLTEAGELEVADRAYFQSGEGGQKLRIDGYAGDPRDSEGVLGLIICDFAEGDTVQTFDSSKLPSLLNPLIRFFRKARDEQFRDSLNEANPAFQISDMIIATWSQITKIKLILISNRTFVGKGDGVPLQDSGGVPVSYSVWDLARFERFDRSGQAREDIVIDFARDFGAPLPALKASQTEAALESYLLIVPGEQLAAIYDKWGARLLEANVRSFLQARAKTNKGIQTTIKDAPELFFPYNNGLSATADAVSCIRTEEGLAVASISNLQIVNGAQTTGSIHAALKSAKEQLPQVFVQMKLTVVPSDRSEEIVPRISEFANTQNKVNAADFFSNHPFHIRMEQFSRDVIFTAREGERHDTKWFYERSRGQFINARARLTSAQQKKFDIEFPKSQFFSKTDLAKFEFSATGQPHIVSRGAQKNFAAFAKDIGEAWSKGDASYDEIWFKRLISKAIIFRWLETEVPKQNWYEGGYRANIVTYAMAKVFHDANGEKQVLDLDAIWRKQSVPEPLQRALLRAAAEAHDVIVHPPAGIRNMSEWAKQQACWNGMKGRKLTYDADFETCLTLVEIAKTAKRDEKAKKAMTDGINAQSEAVNLGADFWRDVLAWGRDRKRLTPKDMQILEVCASIPRRIPTDQQSRYALEVLGRMKDQGYGDA